MSAGFKGGKNPSDALNRSVLAKLGKTLPGNPHVDVGFFSKDQYPDGTPVATVAYWNEKGTKSTPARPFMRNAITQFSRSWARVLGGALTHTKGDAIAALSIAGAEMQADVQESIKSGEYKANSPLTNLLKDRFPKGDYTTEDFLQAIHDVKSGVTAPEGKTLVWSGKLFQAVSYEVSNGRD